MTITQEITNETRTYRLTGTTPLLGSNPANPKIHSEYVAAKAAALEKALEETAMLPNEEELKAELREKLEQVKTMGFTVFLRDGDDHHLVIGNHVVKGFLKAAMLTLKDQLGITSPKSKVDNLVFVGPTYLPIMRDGQPITAPDDYNERPLRAETMQGPRVSLASSEHINAPWYVDVSITLIANNAPKGKAGAEDAKPKSKALTFDAIETALSYGAFKGLGQWRNGGYGSFTVERLK